MPKTDLPKRIAFVSNALTGTELEGGNRDASLMFNLLTDPALGACSISSPHPLHQCESFTAFEQALKRLLEHWHPADQLIFYFSGHGELRAGKYCLKFGTTGKDFLPFDNILNHLSTWNVTRAIIILDTCYSGDATGIKTEDIIQQTIINQQLPKGIAILASSRPGELSRELSDGSSSVFTHLFCEGLQTGLKNNPTIDGFITISDIVEFITRQLETDTKFSENTQRPAYSITAADRSIWVSKNISGSQGVAKSNVTQQLANTEELRFLYETYPDQLPCFDATLEELDIDLIEQYYAKIFSRSLDHFSEEIINQLHLYSPIPHLGKSCLHKSAVLCFSKIPSLYYPDARSTFVAGEIAYGKFIRYDIDGPLSKQIEILIEKTLSHLEVFSSIGKDGKRDEKEEIDKELIRELISNAIAHRNYDLSGNVTVRIKPDVVEIENPGKFPDDFSWSTILENKTFYSRRKNPLISHFLTRLLFFEGVGKGLAVVNKYITENGPDSVRLIELPGPVTCISILRPKQIVQLKPEGNVILGETYKLLVNSMGAFTPPPDLVQLRQEYLMHIERSFRALDFKGIPQLRNLPSDLTLDDIYVPLMARPELPEGETWERRLAGRNFNQDDLPEEALQTFVHGGSATPVQIEMVLREKKQVVVLGDPGSGKSTMLKYLALRLAKDQAAPLPILLPLNAYARALSQKELNLQNYLADYYAGRAQGVAVLEPLFQEAIRNGKAIILLDGLDEVQSNRAALVQKVEAFAQEAVIRGNRVVVTSRIVGYRDTPLAPKDWSLYTLLDFSSEAIESFAKKWCLAFEKSTLGDTPEAAASAEIEYKGLLEAIQANPGVARLASNPLLLTILALIKRQGVDLPKSRIKLYDRYLETLIEAWNRARSLDKRSGGESMDYESTLEVLGPLALRIREENPTAGLVSASQLQNWLTDYYTGELWGLKPGSAREKAREFLESVRHYSNLLVERGEGQYGFIHLTFEETLAAYGLVAEGQVERQKMIDHIQRYIVDPAWRETILLSVGVLGLISRQPQGAGEVVRAILKMNCDNEHIGNNLLLAGACLEDVGTVGLGQAAALEIQDALLIASRNRTLPPAIQRDAGFSLGRTGWVPKDLDAWVEIPAGEFLYGNEKRKTIIRAPFAIQKYLVTNLQFKRFIDNDGYNLPEFWSEDGWAWRTGKWNTKALDHLKSILQQRSAEKHDEPWLWRDERWNNPLAPVVGVTWFEAEAYAKWLAKELGIPVRLPTEQEWERAARGIDGREYAWGNKFDRTKLNISPFWKQDDNADWAFNLNYAGTSIIGQFLEGNTPDGISDLSGNVWEWTCSWYEVEQINRVYRGGSWGDSRRDALCSCRAWSPPDLFFDNLGFRLVSIGDTSL